MSLTKKYDEYMKMTTRPVSQLQDAGIVE